jgi:hypothetical protein
LILDAVRAAIDSISGFDESEGGVRLNTHCLYPTNGSVRVLVIGAGDSFVVSDEGGAFREATLAGAEVDYSNRKFKRSLDSQGLRLDRGAIVSPKVSLNALPTAVMLVANASKEMADWMFEHWQLPRARKFKELLKELLKHEFKEVREQVVTGESNKPHTFETVVQFMNGSTLLADAVTRDPNSINARVVANLDVKNAGHENLIQRIIYDDENEQWGAADLNLLKVSGVTLVPFSRSRTVLRELSGVSVGR